SSPELRLGGSGVSSSPPLRFSAGEAARRCVCTVTEGAQGRCALLDEIAQAHQSTGKGSARPHDPPEVLLWVCLRDQALNVRMTAKASHNSAHPGRSP
ncbi:MAG: hypothetical protein ACREEH_02855, partial [Caulobacteraceae bacterium]